MSQVKFDFSGENYVVTGASSGMGKQITVELAEAGARVLAIARGETALKELQALYPNNIFIAAVDVCDYEKLASFIADFVKENGKLNGAVHAAGIVSLTALKLYDEVEAQKIFETSFWAGIKLIQVCTKSKYSLKNSSYVLFSSAGSHNAAKGMFAYASAKAAIRVAVRSLAKELCNRGIRINTVSPGWVKSNMTDKLDETNNTEAILEKHLLGVGHVEDVSGTILFLLSDRSSWITGTDIIIDGGYLA